MSYELNNRYTEEIANHIRLIKKKTFITYELPCAKLRYV